MSIEEGDQVLIYWDGEEWLALEGYVPNEGETILLREVDSNPKYVVMGAGSYEIGDLVYIFPGGLDFNFPPISILPDFEMYLPPPEYTYHDFRIYTADNNQTTYGDSGEPLVVLKTDGTGFYSSDALFAFLFEDSNNFPADCYIDVRMVDNKYFEIWAGPARDGSVYISYLYYKDTLLTYGYGPNGTKSPAMPHVHVILPI
jgi:hypothetical protein